MTEKIIKPKGASYVLKEGKTYSPGETYALCRCGKTKTPPYCDGTHEHIDFDGTETASTEPFKDRLRMVVEGPELTLYDDGRCSLSRFCHRRDGLAWHLVKYADNPKAREEAIAAAVECPSGRLVIFDKEGNEIEPELDPEIVILQDPERGVSGPLFVRGRIPVESSEGHLYEVRNRMTLCRCGQSYNMPFCDAQHVSKGFSDKKKK